MPVPLSKTRACPPFLVGDVAQAGVFQRSSWCAGVHSAGLPPDPRILLRSVPFGGRLNAQVDLRPALPLRQHRGGAAPPSDPLRHPDADSVRFHGHRLGLRQPSRRPAEYRARRRPLCALPERHAEEPHPARRLRRGERIPGGDLDRGARTGGALERHQGDLFDGHRRADPAVRLGDLLLAALRGDRARAPEIR